MSHPRMTVPRRVPELLHDATVVDVTWDRSLATFTVVFDCLRRNRDGSDMADRTVQFTLSGVEALAVGYDSAFINTRPSTFDPGGRVTAADLTVWPYRRQEATLWIDSPLAEDALDAARLDWHAGDPAALRRAATTFYLSFDQWGDFGLPMIHLGLLVGGDAFAITSGGLPLDLDDWERQFGAWWEGWRAYWATDRGDGGSVYVAAIAAAVSPPPDLSYQPPAEPPFDLEPTDAPAGVLRPVRDWFEGHHARDWARVAAADLDITRTPAERAERLERWHLGDAFGCWDYARQIDSWWVEGRRACVVVRGIEHNMPSDGDPAENWEMVWEFPLRRRGDVWTSHGHSTRRAGAGGAEGGPRPWLARWSSGEVR